MPLVKMPTRLCAAALSFGLSLLAANSPAQSVVAWGSSGSGATNVPAGLTDVIQISAQNNEAYALKANGRVVNLGSGLVPSGVTNVKQVMAGSGFALVLYRDGTVQGWGSNTYGQLNVPAGLQGNVAKLASGGWNVLALKTDGTVVGWGYASRGETTVPAGLSGVVDIAIGSDFALARKADGTVVGWGGGGGAAVPAGLVATKIAANWMHALALRPDGTVAAWGANDIGQSDVPPGLANVVDIAAGSFHSLAAKSDGTVVGWGENAYGQCVAPAKVTNAKLVAGGSHFSVVLSPTYEVEVNQESITSGGSATGTVRLPAPAGPGGVTVDLSASKGFLQVPATVTVPEGEITRTFPVMTDPMLGPGTTDFLIISHAGVTNRTPNIQVSGLPTTFSVDPKTTVSGGTRDVVTATIHIDSPADKDIVLGLESSDPAVAVPPTVRLAAGQTTVTAILTHELVAEDREVSVRLVSDGTTAATSSFRLRALIGSVFIDTLEMTSGQTATGSVRLSGKVLDPLNVSLSTSNPALSVPASVTVPVGANWVEFPVSASGSYEGLVTLTATINGKDKTTVVYVGATPAVTGVEIPSIAYGWNAVPVHITLAAPAPAGGARVRLTTTDLALKVPSYAWVPEGATSVDVVANTSDVTSVTSSTIKAEIGASSATDTIEVRPLVLNIDCPDSITGGESFTMTLRFDGPINRRSTVEVDDVFYLIGLPDSVLFLPGETSHAFTIRTVAKTIDIPVTITVHWHGRTVTKDVLIKKA